jgi:uncharacterized membrane protein
VYQVGFHCTDLFRVSVSCHKVQNLEANFILLDFKLSLCSECCMLSSGLFTGVCSLNVLNVVCFLLVCSPASVV